MSNYVFVNIGLRPETLRRIDAMEAAGEIDSRSEFVRGIVEEAVRDD